MSQSQPLVSVVIPVHNGGKALERNLTGGGGGILSQNYPALEILLVENFSSDSSGAVCRRLAENDPRVIALTCHERGTSLARKMGILKARGEYIYHMDQDDRLAGRGAIAGMVAGALEDDSDITQYGVINEYLPGVRRYPRKTEHRFISRKELLREEIAGAMGSWCHALTCNVWTKLYRASVLKSAAERITLSLCSGEDLFLNSIAFMDCHTRRVSIRPESYYVYRVGVGSTGKDDYGERLFAEYDKMKPLLVRYADESGVSPEAMYQFHIESVYFLKSTIDAMIRARRPREEILEKIESLTAYSFERQAREYLRACPKAMAREDLRALSCELSAEEYLRYCERNLPLERARHKAARVIKKIFRRVRGV